MGSTAPQTAGAWREGNVRMNADVDGLMDWLFVAAIVLVYAFLAAARIYGAFKRKDRWF